MRILPTTLTGTLHNLNKGACDWGWQGLVAYGCQNCVVVMDPRTIQVVQTLDKHKGYVIKVKWSRENYHHDIASPYTLRLASADYNGKVIVWDVARASIRAEFSDGSKPVADMEWLSFQDTSHDLLAVLHPPYTLILWNAATGTRLWKKSYTETLQSFSFDPFEPSRLAFLGQDCVVFVDDFSLSKVPSSNGKKYYISSPTSQASNMSNSSSAERLDKKASKQTLGKRVTDILVGDINKKPPEGDSASLNECLQLTFHRACRHHLILLYPREILILDLDINQTVGIVPMERTGSPFTQVLSLHQRDVLMCLHDNGSVTVRVRRRQTNTLPPTDLDKENGNPVVQEVAYDLRCQSDPLRITRHSRVYGVSFCPISETRVSLVMSDSRVLIWELKTVDYTGPNGILPQSPLFTPGGPLHSQSDLPTVLLSSAPLGILTNPSQALPKTALSDMIGHTQAFVTETHSNSTNRHGVLLKFMLTGLLSGVSAPPLVVRMCPPLTMKNWAQYQPWVALGTSTGILQVFNISSRLLVKELSVHSCTIRGIEWVSLHSCMSYAYVNPGPSGLVRNEIMLTDIQTGKSVAYRTNREDEMPIETVRVSYLKQYFVVVFKDKPFELWDLRSGSLLRQMPKNFPHVTALEWSPAHLTKSIKKKSGNLHESGSSLSQSNLDLTGTSVLDPAGRGDSKPQTGGSAVREHFVFTDTNGLLYHFILEGNMLKDGSKIPPDGSMGSITSIAWKAETLVLSDVDGNLNLWDLKARVSRAVPTHRGWIRKIKFAPGRGYMKLLVLYSDGVDIWDTKEVDRVSSIRCPKDMAKILDVDWAASDRPVLVCADGVVRVMDLTFQLGCSPLEDNQLTDPVFSPHLLAPKLALTLKYLLQHQPWNPDYQLHLAETEENADITAVVNEQLDLIDSDIKEYLPHCHFGTAERSLIAARLFGDESELTFWTVALHYLRTERAEPMNKRIPRSASSQSSGDLFIPSTPASESHDLLQLSDEGQGQTGVKDSDWAFIKDKPLETCYDLLCDSSTFQKYQLNRIWTHDSKRVTYDHTKKCIESLIYLGQTDRAVQLLLETESDCDQYYVDCLRACLVASIRSSGASQSTIKLVATNLIASGKLSEGVQLLCLIDKGLDSCRYLQDYGQWEQATWLAKATLDYAEYAEIMKRWVDHLCSPQVNLKSRAVLVLLSLGQFTRALELLHSMRHFDRAALFSEACQEFGLLDDRPHTKQLTDSIFVEYARFLLHLGNRPACEYYCLQAGEKGKLLMEDINSRVNTN